MRRREMLDLARTGEYSDAELADIFGYKESSVAVYRNQERIAMGGPPKRDLIHERIREVIRENPDAGAREIADLAQSCYGTVRRILDPEEYAVLLEKLATERGRASTATRSFSEDLPCGDDHGPTEMRGGDRP